MIHTLPGLSAQAEIVVDRWGVPHIRAASARDAFMVQGWNAARDRLWQIDLWRKRGLGMLAADHGPAYLAQDRAARLFVYRGDMDAEWACYGPDARDWTHAFVDGINAYVELTRRDPNLLPVEFRRLGLKPARWLAEDVVRVRSHARVRNMEQEFLRQNVAARFGLETDQLRKRLEPAWTPILPDGWSPEPIPPEVLATYQLAGAQVAFAAAFDTPSAADEGSNNWALAPNRTTTGRAILASDPHRLHELPSLRYLVHLKAPGLDVIGAGEPSVPGVSLGHNQRAAFGLTIFPTDQEDLYVYETHPDDPTRYRYGDGWEAMTLSEEEVEVAGGGRHVHRLAFTHHGPVLHTDPGQRRAWALRTAWSLPGTAAYLASLGYQRAGSWAEFTDALEGWGAPSANHVYADVDGHIGWAAAGFVPKRESWDGLLPVPGDGRHEWCGHWTARDLPRIADPKDGYVATANQMNLPPDFDVGRKRIGFDWSNRSRFERITEVLAGDRRFSFADMVALQTDVTSIPARRVTALLADLPAGAPGVAEARRLFAGWDHRLAADSAPAALFEPWFQHRLLPAVIDRLAPTGARAHFGLVLDAAVALDALEADDPRLGGRGMVMAATLAEAWEFVATKLGPDPAAWRWGDLHHGFFEHALAKRLAAPELNVGPGPKAGSGLTVNSNGYRAGDLRVVEGVSFRMVCDVGNWDASVVINAPGQSGDPGSRHYRDLFDLWSADRYFPMAYSDEAVAKVAERRILLMPSTTGG